MQSFLFLLSLLMTINILQAQDPCMGSYREYFLNSNNIRASFFPRGNKFASGNGPGFLVPYPNDQRLSTVYASSIWIGGVDDAGNMKVAAETFPSSNNVDFSVGPLSEIGTQIDSICLHFDRVWNVYYEDIQAHILDYIADGIINDTIESIFGWPARRNKYFSRFNGFELPHGGDWADFNDKNQNQEYEPELGDYPAAIVNGYSYIPDQMMWMIFNDINQGDTIGSNPLRLEFHLTAFAFHCQENTWLNNTVFASYKIFSRAVQALDSVFFGTWIDYDLGCSEDDFMGSDSARSTEFIYNDLQDGNEFGDCLSGVDTYNQKPPAQSMTYLSEPMHAFIAIPFSSNYSSEGMYNMLNGKWPDGRFIRPEGDGYITSPDLEPTRYLFNGDPRDPFSWAAINEQSVGSDIRSVSSVSLGRMDPGSTAQIDLAFMFHHDLKGDNLDQITLMHQNVDSLLLASVIRLNQGCTLFPYCLDGDCVWPGDFDHNGIADSRDYVMWAAMNGSSGDERNGLISWRGHYSQNWQNTLDGINAKHGDGDGNGRVDLRDIDINAQNLLLTNSNYDQDPVYREGPELVLTADAYIDNNGRIRNFKVMAGKELLDVVGIAFEIEFDTSLFKVNQLMFHYWPDDDNKLVFNWDFNQAGFPQVAIVQTNSSGITIPDNFNLLRIAGASFDVKNGKTIPDSTVIRLRNIIARTPDGTDLLVGSEPLVIYSANTTDIEETSLTPFQVFPNPVDDILHINAYELLDCHLINLQGKIMDQFKIGPGSTYDVSDLVPGMYYLSVYAHGQAVKVVVY